MTKPLVDKEKAIELRKGGATHREIADVLCISPSTACTWTKNIELNVAQKDAIKRRRNTRSMTPEQKKECVQRLKEANSYTEEELLKRIKNFYAENKRIPLKREFNAWEVYATRFGSWNAAIVRAGFEPNPVLFSKKFIAADEHICDSYSEQLIDNFLSERSIPHTRNAPYPNSRFTADFQIGDDAFVEFFGLAGVNNEYDKNMEKKRELAREHGIRLVEIYPSDLYPESKLPQIVGDTGFEPVTSRV